ncbi:MAG TPA: hypothetical protein VE398_08450, partial [Acidobacteriota bacterium]|nr:hypothetical protein [Acidobacteriota bacterium]
MKDKFLTAVLLLGLFASRGAFAQNQYCLPHFANGKFGTVSFRTTFILFNNTNSPVQAVLAISDDGGNPLSTTIGGLGSGSQFTLNLDAGATSILQTDGSGNGAVGAAKVTATAVIGVSAIFTIYDANGNYMTEAGVGSSDPLTDFVLPVDSTGAFLTGLALFNPGDSAAAITLTLINTDGGQADSPASKSLSAGGHTAFFVAAAGQLFPSVTNFRGTLRVRSSVPIAALVLRQYQNSTQLSYTSLPAVPSTSTRLGLNLAHAANGSYGSISFKTSFLIFNISSSAANVVLTLTRDNGSAFVVTFPGSGPGTGTNNTFSFTLAAGASVFLQTDGLGAGTSGSATITSDVPIGASAIFTVFDSHGQFQTEAGVGDSPVLTSLTIPVDLTGSFDTGVAFFNPGSGSTVLSFTLLDSTGTIAGSGSQQTLVAKNHLAVFVDQLFPGTKNFRGSLAVSASAGVSATTLRQNSVSSSYTTYTTLPIASGTASGRAQVALLLSKTETGITATGNLRLDETLSSGFKLSGTVTGSNPSDSSQGRSITASAGGNSQYASMVNPQTHKYLMV